MKNCSHCRKEKPLYDFHKDKSSRDGFSHRCKDCSIRQQKQENIQESRKRSYKKNILEYRRRTKEWEQTIRGKFHKYKQGAKIRNMVFELTLEQFSTFWKKPCDYCGSDINTIGLDRVDNERGYTMNNIVSCCETCNWMKLDLDTNTFIEHCKKITQNFNKIIN